MSLRISKTKISNATGRSLPVASELFRQKKKNKQKKQRINIMKLTVCVETHPIHKLGGVYPATQHLGSLMILIAKDNFMQRILCSQAISFSKLQPFLLVSCQNDFLQLCRILFPFNSQQHYIYRRHILEKAFTFTTALCRHLANLQFYNLPSVIRLATEYFAHHFILLHCFTYTQ